jgi:hypothetical protein
MTASAAVAYTRLRAIVLRDRVYQFFVLKEVQPMPRPKHVDRPIDKKISIPESVVAEIDLELFSEIEGKVPHGAWARLINELLVKHIKQRKSHERAAQRAEERRAFAFAPGKEGA